VEVEAMMLTGEAKGTRHGLIGALILCALGAAPAPARASLCGDGVVEGWEECDDGDRNGSGRCCSVDCIQMDADGDTVCDALDPCTSPAAVQVDAARVRITRRGGDAVLVFRASLDLPAAGLDPASSGVRLVVSQIYSLGIVLDLTVPGGPGWRATSEGATWRYRDPSGQIDGVTAVTVRRSPLTGAVAVTIRGRHARYPLMREALPAKLAVTFAPGVPETDQCGESWLARSLCTTDSSGGLDCVPPVPIRPCSGDPNQLVRCDLRNAASAQEWRFITTGEYLAGDCRELPGFIGSPGVVCTTASAGITFSAVTAHGSATQACAWVSDPPPGTPTITCSDWPPPATDSARARR
jgi:hypothetical protein